MFVLIVINVFMLILMNLIEPNSNYTNAVKHFGVKLSEIGEESYEKKSELFEALFSIKIPKSTIFDHEDKVSDNYIETKEQILEELVEEKGLKDNGVYHYDEQFPHCKWRNYDTFNDYRFQKSISLPRFFR